MPPRRTQSNQPHRVVCLCSAFECGVQVYPDANGVYQPGVEVLPETRAAHEHADFKESLMKAKDNPKTPPISSAQDALLSPLRKLHLATTPSPSPNRRSGQQLYNKSSTELDGDYLKEVNLTPEGHQHSPETPLSQSTPPQTPSQSIKTCSNTVLAKETGHQVFDCGTCCFTSFSNP